MLEMCKGCQIFDTCKKKHKLSGNKICYGKPAISPYFKASGNTGSYLREMSMQEHQLRNSAIEYRG